MGRSEQRQRTKLVGIRCTPDELRQIDAAAAESGQSRSAYIRSTCLWRSSNRKPAVAAPQHPGDEK